MSSLRTRSCRCRWGASLIELLVVLAIIAILVSLLLVAVQYSRAAARRTVCQNNLRQLSLAMRTYVETRKRYPDLAIPDQASGWVVELLPFLEEQPLKDELDARPVLTGANVSPLARKRPPLFTCPDGFGGDSAIEGIPAAHYMLEHPLSVGEPRPWSKVDANRKRRRWWSFFCAPLESRVPWAAGPEDYDYHCHIRVFKTGPLTGPHSGGFHAISFRDEGCTFQMPPQPD